MSLTLISFDDPEVNCFVCYLMEPINSTIALFNIKLKYQ